MADDAIVGYERVVNEGACDLCQAASGQLYHSDDLMPIHDACACDVAPVLGSDPRARKLARQPNNFEGLRETPTPEPLSPEQVAPAAYNLTPEQVRAMFDYQTGFLIPVNDHLRGRLTGEMHPALQKALATMNSALQSVPKLGRDVRAFRGLAGTPAEVFGRSTLIRGLVLDDPGFASTSASRTPALNAANMWRQVDGRAGTQIWTLTVDQNVRGIYLNRLLEGGEFRQQNELLLERGCRFVVQKVERKGGMWNVEAKVLPPAGAA